MSAKRVNRSALTGIIILVLCAVVGLALTSVLFFGRPSPAYASAVIQFTFDGAADGLAPNGTAFDLSALASDEVLSEGLDTAALADRYAVDQIRGSLVVRGVYPEDMAKQVMSYESLLNFTANREMTVGDFHPTTFNVALYSDFDKSISQASLEALLRGIMDAYEGYFARVYANGLDGESMIFDLDEYDYPQQLEIIQDRLNMLARYSQEMYERRPTFRYEGTGFNDISVRLNNLINSDITRLNADLTINALTRDTARLLTQYQFEVRDLSNQLEKQNQQLEQMDALIASYDKNEIIYLSTADSLTKIDGNSSETYDQLVNKRKEVADGITEINSQIADYQLKLSDLLKEEQDARPARTNMASLAAIGGEQQQESTLDDVVEMTDEEIAEAAAEAERLAKAQTQALEQNIDALVAKGDAIIKDYKAMLDAFNAEEINDLTVTVSKYKYETPRLVSGAFIKKAIMTAGPICAIGLMICLALVIAGLRKAGKQH